jgi:hypothetical protein
VDHGDLHSGDSLRASFIHRRDLLHAFFLQPHAEFENSDGNGVDLFADLDRISDVIAVAMSAEHRVGFLDGLLAFGAHGIAGDPGINVEGLPFRRLDAEGGVAEPRKLNSLKIHGWTPMDMRIRILAGRYRFELTVPVAGKLVFKMMLNV